MSTTINLPVHGITIELYSEGEKRLVQHIQQTPNHCLTVGCGGSITSDLKESFAEQHKERHRSNYPGAVRVCDCHNCKLELASYNAAIDGLERLVLAQACLGINVQTPAYLEALETAIDAIGNEYGE